MNYKNENMNYADYLLKCLNNDYLKDGYIDYLSNIVNKKYVDYTITKPSIIEIRKDKLKKIFGNELNE